MNDKIEAGCDLLVVSPHTDDAEIGLGGVMAAWAAAGRRVWALDLTRGELGSNATPEERWAEGVAAAEVLGLAGRVQLELPDGFVDATNPEHVGAVGSMLRRLRPRWVVTAPEPRRHPDHVVTPALVEKAIFHARLAAWRPDEPVHRVWGGGAPLPADTPTWQVEARFDTCPVGGEAALLVDISAHWQTKRRALDCYASQFARGDGRRATMINEPAFLEEIERRARAWGRRAGVDHAEALSGTAVPLVTDLPGEVWC
ncbi:MAG: bacillithiol biosynthesis deacetylase BshB1 [bacterium]|nr:bacillithiol biosynthesis deacetylase BshB1 [bacterium]